MSLKELRGSVAYKRRRTREPYTVTIERDRLDLLSLKDIVHEEIKVRRRDSVGVSYARQSVKGALGIDCPTPRVPTRRNVAFVAKAVASSPLVAEAIISMPQEVFFKVVDRLVVLGDCCPRTAPVVPVPGETPPPPLASDDNEPWFYADTVAMWLERRDAARRLAAADSLAALATLLDRAHAMLEAAKDQRSSAHRHDSTSDLGEVIARMSSMPAMTSIASAALRLSVVEGIPVPKFSGETTEPLVKHAFELLEALRLDGGAFYQVRTTPKASPEGRHHFEI